MTIICALYDPKERGFWLGSNSRALSGDTIIPNDVSKWVKFTDWAIGLSGHSVGMDALKAERAKFPNQTDEVAKVVQFIRAAFERYEIGEREDALKEFGVAGLLVHKSGEMFDLDPALAVDRIPENTLWARGSGRDFALGADYAAKQANLSPEERMQYAVEAAIALDSGCPGKAILESF